MFYIMKGYDIEGAGTAIRFLTIFNPGKLSSELTREKAAAAIPFFPVAGLVAGAVSAAAVIVLSPIAGSDFARAVFAVAALAIVTRGLHLDGVGDCFDALHYFGNRDKAFAVMKDKSLGGFGTAAVAFVIAAKIAALGSVPSGAFIGALVAVPAVSRFGSVIVSYLSEETADGGLGGIFNRIENDAAVKAAALAFFIPLLLCGFGGIMIALLVSVSAFALTLFFRNAFGNANGDVHGAVIEICEVVGFIVAGSAL